MQSQLKTEWWGNWRNNNSGDDNSYYEDDGRRRLEDVILWERKVDTTKSLEDRIKVVFNEGVVYDEFDQERYKFSYNITESYEDEIYFKVDFDNPSLVG